MFESCERKNTYRNSKVEGMEENHFHTTVTFLSFAIYLLFQGPFKDELWSICFCLVPFSWFINVYITKKYSMECRGDWKRPSFYLSMCKHDKKEQSRSSKGNGNPFLQQGFFGSAMLCFKSYLMHMCRFMKTKICAIMR